MNEEQTEVCLTLFSVKKKVLIYGKIRSLLYEEMSCQISLEIAESAGYATNEKFRAF